MPGIQLLVRGGGFGQHPGQIKRLFFGVLKALLQPGGFAHAVQDTSQALGGGGCTLQVLLPFVLGDSLGQVFKGRTHHRDRGFQLVGEASGKALQILIVVLQSGYHLGKVLLQLPEFVPASG